MLKVLFLFLAASGPLGCSTLFEALTPDEPTGSYRKVKDEKGHTKYVSHRVVRNPRIPAPIEPLPLTPPQTAAPVDTALANPSQSRRAPLNTNTLQKIDAPKKDSSFAVGFELASSKKATHGDIHGDYQANPYMNFRIGASFFNSDRLYLGLSSGLRFQMPWTVSPFVGLGGYLGDNKRCETQPLGNGDFLETCEKYFLANIYPEAGLRVQWNKSFRMLLYTRYYSRISQAGDQGYSPLYGIALQFF